MKRLRTASISLVFLFLTTAAVRAQEFRATIVGRISEPSGAIVPGARVRVVNLETQVENSSASNATGDYVIPALLPGRYRLEAEHPGFKKYVREAITLNIQDRVTVDVKFELGELTSSVTVSADVSLLETSTASRGATITQRNIVDMPLFGRNSFSLVMLSPGVNYTSRGQAYAMQRPSSTMSGLSMSGAAPGFSETVLDGIPITGGDGTMQYVPSVDAAQEFKVQTNVFDAEFGRFSGGLLNGSIKSGTNQLHGSLFHFARNSVFNARDPFATEIPQFNYNQFGGGTGGPVVLPKYNGKNRTFFFFNAEMLREGVPRAFVATVPTDLQRAGDFSKTMVRVPGRDPAPLIVYDPATTRRQGTAYVRDVFPGNAIPAGRMDAVARNSMALYPQPNAPGDSVTGSNNLLRSYKDVLREDNAVVRVDHRFSDSHAVFGRYYWRKYRVTRRGEFNDDVTGDTELRGAFGVALDDTYTISPATVLNLRYGLSRYRMDAMADNLGFDLRKLGFPESLVRTFSVQAIPAMEIGGFTTLSGKTKYQYRVFESHNLRGNVLHIRGSHAMRLGGEARLMRTNRWSSGNSPTGAYSFTSTFTRGPNPQVSSVTAGSGLASFLLGLGSGGSIANNAALAEQTPYYGFYFQDDVRLSSKLTLNVGLRYEWDSATTERYNRLNRGFDFSADSPIAAAAKAKYAASPIAEVPVSAFQVKGGLMFAGVNGQPRSLTDVDRNNVAPRIGVAYNLTPKTVLRGGYGMFYGSATPLDDAAAGFSASTAFVGTIDGGLTPVNTLSNPFPDGVMPPPGASQGLQTLMGQGISFVTSTRRQPFSHQFQGGIQRELPGQVLVDAAYSASLGRDLPVDHAIDAVPLEAYLNARRTFQSIGRNILNDTVPNPFYGIIQTGTLNGQNTTRGQLLRPYPQFTSVSQLDQSIGASRYDSFQLKVTRRFKQGFTFLGAYTAAKLLTQSSYQNDQDALPVKQLAGYDISQRLNITTNWELPFGPGRRFLSGSKGLTRKLVEGYQINVIYTAQSGVPVVIGSESIGRSARIDNSTVDRWFDTAAFRQRETLELVATSTLPDVRTAGKNNFDCSIFKNVSVTERFRLQVRAEASNALNRPEWSGPGTGFGSANFGKVTSTNSFMRQLQVALKLLW